MDRPTTVASEVLPKTVAAAGCIATAVAAAAAAAAALLLLRVLSSGMMMDDANEHSTNIRFNETEKRFEKNKS